MRLIFLPRIIDRGTTEDGDGTAIRMGPDITLALFPLDEECTHFLRVCSYAGQTSYFTGSAAAMRDFLADDVSEIDPDVAITPGEDLDVAEVVARLEGWGFGEFAVRIKTGALQSAPFAL